MEIQSIKWKKKNYTCELASRMVWSVRWICQIGGSTKKFVPHRRNFFPNCVHVFELVHRWTVSPVQRFYHFVKDFGQWHKVWAGSWPWLLLQEWLVCFPVLHGSRPVHEVKTVGEGATRSRLDFDLDRGGGCQLSKETDVLGRV